MTEHETYAKLRQLAGTRVLLVDGAAKVAESSILFACDFDAFEVDPAQGATFFKPRLKIKVSHERDRAA